MMSRHSILIIALVLASLISSASADCTSPAAVQGTIDYFSSANTNKFCDGLNWLAITQCGTTLTGCTTAGQMDYDSSITNFKMCNGTDWKPLIQGLAGSSCTTAGQIEYASASLTFNACDGSNWRPWTPTSGLLGYWKFEDGSGTTATASVGTSGTLTNAPTWTTGKMGGALSFSSASSQYVDMGDPADGSLDLGTGDFSIAFWMKVSDPSTFTTDGFIVSKGNSFGGSKRYYKIFRDYGGGCRHLTFNLSDDTAGSAQLIDTAYSCNSTFFGLGTEWNHYAITVSRSGTSYMYVNATSVGSADLSSQSGDVSNTGSFHLGASRSFNGGDAGAPTGFYLNGQLDDVRIYNRALSASEVKDLYDNGNGC